MNVRFFFKKKKLNKIDALIAKLRHSLHLIVECDDQYLVNPIFIKIPMTSMRMLVLQDYHAPLLQLHISQKCWYE